MKKLIFFCALGMTFATQAAEPDFRVVCQLLQLHPIVFDYPAHFTRDFRDKISREKLMDVFADLSTKSGRCLSYKSLSSGPDKFSLTIASDKNLAVIFAVTIEKSSGLLSGLLLKGIFDPSFEIKNWDDAGKALAGLDPNGQLSATFMTSNGAVASTHKSMDALAIGSIFKLYILGALENAIAEGRHAWDEILPLTDEWKSLPSGIMQEWPAGRKVSLYEYAEKMISLSDNTATDHLLYFLGREKVERMLVPMGNSHESNYLPLLSTLEMFKLKWAVPPTETDDYLRMDRESRLTVLARLKQVPRSQVGENGAALDRPVLINQLEWFATTEENCRAMFWLVSRDNPQVRSILSKNVPFVEDVRSATSHWSYVGYKGGSEAGVLSMTFLLETQKGNRACFSMTWNNEKENVSEAGFMDVVKKTLAFAETQVP